MLSKRYESTEVDRRTWIHVSSGTHWSTSSDTHQVVEIQISYLQHPIVSNRCLQDQSDILEYIYSLIIIQQLLYSGWWHKSHYITTNSHSSLGSAQPADWLLNRSKSNPAQYKQAAPFSRFLRLNLSPLVFFTSQATVFQSYMCRRIEEEVEPTVGLPTP